MTRTVITLLGGSDPRCVALLKAMDATMREYGKGMPIPSVLGVIELLKHHLITTNDEDRPQ